MDESEEYTMGNIFRGHAIIITNEKFAAGIADRKGARMDGLKMKSLFQALDFQVTTFMDMTADEMKTAIKNGVCYFV